VSPLIRAEVFQNRAVVALMICVFSLVYSFNAVRQQTKPPQSISPCRPTVLMDCSFFTTSAFILKHARSSTHLRLVTGRYHASSLRGPSAPSSQDGRASGTERHGGCCRPSSSSTSACTSPSPQA
jgi:hypothetical protein